MTALQLNAEIYRSLGIIAEDESMLAKVAGYVRRLARQMNQDPSLMSKEAFFARVDEAKKGKTYSMLPGESLEQMLDRVRDEL